MRVKSMLIFIVLNIFLMLFSSVMFEYIDLEDRLNNITTVINDAGDAAVKVSTASEELFTAGYVEHETSYGIVNTTCPIHQHVGDGTKVATNILLFDEGGNAHQVNTYALAYYYCSTGQIPKTSGDFNNVQRIGQDMSTEDVYRFLYGESGTDYKNASLSWATRNSSILKIFQNENVGVTSRRMNTSENNAAGALGGISLKGEYNYMNDFQSYVEKIFESVYTTNIIKEKSSDANSNYTMNFYCYPVLLNMGLKMRGYSPSLEILNAENKNEKLSGKDWNHLLDVGSNLTNDYFTSSFHFGKTRQFGVGQSSSATGISNGMYSKYFLTPNTLGVTYVPLSVVKPNFIGLVRTKVQLNKVSGGKIEDTNDFKKVIKETKGCVDTTIYETSHGVVGNVSQKHTVDANEDIVNDGDIEYDLNSIKVKVDYFDCDFYNDDKIDSVINRIEGAVPNWVGSDGSNYGKAEGLFDSQHQNLDALRQKLLATDSKQHVVYDKDGNDGRGKRVVARVTFRMKVHIPYHSSILQWMCHKDNNSAHFDIRQYAYDDINTQEKGGHAVMDKSGVWYQYTTYYSVTR